MTKTQLPSVSVKHSLPLSFSQPDSFADGALKSKPKDGQQNEWNAASLTSSAAFQITPPGSYTTDDDTLLMLQFVRPAGSPAPSCGHQSNNTEVKQSYFLP